MTTAWCKNRFEILDCAAKLALDEGLILEFGVAHGATINYLATSFPLRSRRLYGFDSFCGLPEPWGDYPVGHFACAVPDVPNNVTLVVGMFAETIPDFLATHSGHAALVHIDCDLYSSTRTVLELIEPRMVTGTIVVLDEYWIVEEHERRAFDEWLLTHKRGCIHLFRSNEQACVAMF